MNLKAFFSSDRAENSIMQTITIAVSAILIAAGLVTAPGLINNARDNNVRGDLANIAYAQEFKLGTDGTYFTAGTDGQPILTDAIEGVKYTLSNEIKVGTEYKVYVCHNPEEYLLVATSKSEKTFYRSSDSGLTADNADAVTDSTCLKDQADIDFGNFEPDDAAYSVAWASINYNYGATPSTVITVSPVSGAVGTFPALPSSAVGEPDYASALGTDRIYDGSLADYWFSNDSGMISAGYDIRGYKVDDMAFTYDGVALWHAAVPGYITYAAASGSPILVQYAGSGVSEADLEALVGGTLDPAKVSWKATILGNSVIEFHPYVPEYTQHTQSIAGTYGDIGIGSVSSDLSTILIPTSAGINRSVDGGNTFTTVSLAPSNVLSASERFLNIGMSDNGNKAFIARPGYTYDNAAYSTDKGATWTPVAVNGSYGSTQVLAWDYVGDKLYALVFSDDGGSGKTEFMYSADGGASWAVVDNNLSIPFTSNLMYRLIGNADGHTFNVFTQNVTNASDASQYRSTDNGHNWAQSTLVTSDSNGSYSISTVASSTDGNVIGFQSLQSGTNISYNGGASFAIQVGSFIHVSKNSGIVYRFMADGSFDKSTNNGSTWTHAGNDVGAVGNLGYGTAWVSDDLSRIIKPTTANSFTYMTKN